MAQVEIEELGNCKKKLVIEIPAEKVTEELDKRTDELRRSAEVPGFRKGHIPPRLFERRFGKKLRDAIKSDLLEESFEEALGEHELEPLGEPEFPGIEEIELERESAFKYEVQLTVKPQVKVEDYVGVKVRAEEIEVTDEEVEQTIEQLRRERAELVVVEDRPVTEEDMVMVDVGVTAEGQTLHSSKGSYLGVASKGIFGIEVPDFSEKFLGRNRGDTVELEFELPKTSALEYDEELIGKTAHCTLKISEIKMLNVPEATDEWAKEIGMESLEELKKKVREGVNADKERARDRYVEKKILDNLLGACSFEVPAELMDARAQELTEYRRYQLMRAGVPYDKIDADLDMYRELSRQEIERNFRESLVLVKIAEMENVFVTEDEVDSAIAQIALREGQSPEALREEMDSRGLVSRLRDDLLESRVKEFLRKKAQVELVAPGTLAKEEETKSPKEEEKEPEESKEEQKQE